MSETPQTIEQVFEGFDKPNQYIPEDGVYDGIIATDKKGNIAVKQDYKNFQVRFALAEVNGDGTAGRWVWASLNTRNPREVTEEKFFEGAKKGLGITSRTLKALDKTIKFSDKSDWSSTDLTDFTASILAKFAGIKLRYAVQRRVDETGAPVLDKLGNRRYNVYIRSLA